MKEFSQDPDTGSSSKSTTIFSRIGSIGLGLGALSIPTCFALDKCTDLSLQFSHMRNLDTAHIRRATVLQIRRHFKISTVNKEVGIGSLSQSLGEDADISDIQAINQETGFPTSIGIEALVSQSLPEIMDNPLAQIALDNCKKVQNICIEQTKGQCLTPHKSLDMGEAVKNEMNNKFNYSSIRHCSINTNQCESDLAKCIQENVISQCQKCRSME